MTTTLNQTQTTLNLTYFQAYTLINLLEKDNKENNEFLNSETNDLDSINPNINKNVRYTVEIQSDLIAQLTKIKETL